MKNILTSLALFALIASSAFAQTNRPIPYPVFTTAEFDRAVEHGTRTLTGEPGVDYWTNTADYTIQTQIDIQTNMLTGQAAVTYNNNSPDTLEFVVVHLRQNLHKEGAIRNRPQQVTGGMKLHSIHYGDIPIGKRENNDGPGFFERGTVLGIWLPQPIVPGTSADFRFEWEFEIPKAGAPRMGQDGEVYYIAYWYPQFAVYDDVNTWKADQYQANGEFYMGYGNYSVDITAPEGWLVAATGTLQNPDKVLSKQVRDRLKKLDRDTITHVVKENEREPGLSTAKGSDGMLTWTFDAEDVRDFAFGLSNKYVWDATIANVGDADGDGVDDSSVIHSLYRPGTSSWERSAEFGRFSVEHLSEILFPYPYPHMTAVEGIIGGGMEFPMITLIGGGRTDRSLFGVTYHEIGHMWFPMIVGQDEKSYTWMDEGLTSFNTTEGSSAFFDSYDWKPSRQSYYFIAGRTAERPPMLHADEYPYGTPARGIASYSKPAVAMHALRGVLGDETYWKAYREYAKRWMYKHPQPYDLFNTFEDVSGQDLDWFWTSMLYNTWTMDHAIGQIEETDNEITVQIVDKGLVPMPSPVTITYVNGESRTETIPVEVWLGDATESTLRFPPGVIESIEIDKGEFLPDVDRSNNVWKSSAVSEAEG